MSFKNTIKDIKELKVQGAQQVAIASILDIKELIDDGIYKDKEHLLERLNKAKEELIKTRPTEPAMRNALNYILSKNNYKRSEEHTS